MISNLSIADLERIRDEARAHGDCMTANKAQECIIRRGIYSATLLENSPSDPGPATCVLRIIVNDPQAIPLMRWIEQTLGIKVEIKNVLVTS